MLPLQADKGALGIRIPTRAAFAEQIGQIEQPVRSGRRRGNAGVDNVIGTFALLLGEDRFALAKLFFHPSVRNAGSLHRTARSVFSGDHGGPVKGNAFVVIMRLIRLPANP